VADASYPIFIVLSFQNILFLSAYGFQIAVKNLSQNPGHSTSRAEILVLRQG
jgi:hypothetical protein